MIHELHPSKDPSSECYGCEVLQCYMCSGEAKNFHDEDSFCFEENIQPAPQRYIQRYKECRNCGEIQTNKYLCLEWDTEGKLKGETGFSSCTCGCCIGTIFFIYLEDFPFANGRPLEWHEYKKNLKNKDVARRIFE